MDIMNNYTYCHNCQNGPLRRAEVDGKLSVLCVACGWYESINLKREKLMVNCNTRFVHVEREGRILCGSRVQISVKITDTIGWRYCQRCIGILAKEVGGSGAS